jgi:hypothetical protein
LSFIVSHDGQSQTTRPKDTKNHSKTPPCFAIPRIGASLNCPAPTPNPWVRKAPKHSLIQEKGREIKEKVLSFAFFFAVISIDKKVSGSFPSSKGRFARSQVLWMLLMLGHMSRPTGRGVLVGVPGVFVRLAGCPLRCRWCERKYSWDENIILPVFQTSI